MNQLTTFTYRELIQELERFDKADLLNLDTAVALRVGGGIQTKNITGYSLGPDGLVLTISGNEPSITPRKKKGQAKIGPGEPA